MIHKFLPALVLFLGCVAGSAPGQTLSTGAKRSVQELQAENVRLYNELMRTIGPREMLLDPSIRPGVAMNAVPILHGIQALADEIEASGGGGAQVAATIRPQVDDLLCIFEDQPTLERLRKVVDEDPGPAGIRAERSLIFGRWICANKQAQAQQQVLDELQKLAERVPASDSVAELTQEMLEAGPADDLCRERIARIVAEKLTSPTAKRLKSKMEAEITRAGLENKPLLIMGQRANGQMLTTKAWIGNVVLAIFWSSESQACRKENDEWRRLYNRYHDKGLEIVGIPCDHDPQRLNNFLRDNPGTIWPQLFDPQQPGMHQLAKDLGVTEGELPMLFLIDRTGVLRTTKARHDTDKLIRDLLQDH